MEFTIDEIGVIEKLADIAATHTLEHHAKAILAFSGNKELLSKIEKEAIRSYSTLRHISAICEKIRGG